MKNSKTELKFFDIMDYDREADYLSLMHGKGWKFRNVSFPGLYHFTECEPEEVRYELDYNKEGRAEKDEYRQMFTDMGWEYIQDFVGYSYFRKPVVDGEETDIFCDDDSRAELMKRIFRGRMIPMIIFFCLLMIPMIHHVINGPDAAVSALFTLISPIGVIFLLYVWIFARFIIKYQNFRKRIGK